LAEARKKLEDEW